MHLNDKPLSHKFLSLQNPKTINLNDVTVNTETDTGIIDGGPVGGRNAILKRWSWEESRGIHELMGSKL